MISIEQTMQEGFAHHQAGRFPEAEQAYRAVLQQQPENPDALHLLGLIARSAGRLDLAEQLVRRACELAPTTPHFAGNLGLILVELKRPAEAAAALRRAVELAPEYAPAHNNLGVALRDQGLFAESVPAFNRAIELQPRFAEAYSNLAGSLMRLQRQSEALAAATTAVELNPGLINAHYNLGTALAESDRFEEAIGVLTKVVTDQPEHYHAWMNLGNAHRSLGRLDQAMTAYSTAIASSADFADAHWNLALTALLNSDFELGWMEHEWRFACESLDRPQKFWQRQWRGEPLNGQTILLHAEQGLGDSIQFVRYAPLVAEAGGKVLLQCQAPLLKLFEMLPGVERVFSREDGSTPLPNFDWQCPLMSLPLAFGTRLDSVPAKVPYLFASDEKQSAWKQRLQSVASPLKVGLVWAGSATHKSDRKRSIQLSQLQPLAPVPGTAFVSLQKGAPCQQLAALKTPWPLLDFTSELNDFTETAALISQLDLVISVDTSVAHLAGAMGKPVWLMLHSDPDWRWMLNRTDSPWYPTMRLFRQPRAGDWASVISNMESALRQLLQDRQIRELA